MLCTAMAKVIASTATIQSTCANGLLGGDQMGSCTGIRYPTVVGAHAGIQPDTSHCPTRVALEGRCHQR